MISPHGEPSGPPTSGADITAQVKEARRMAFGGYAADYHRARPGWSDETVRWMLGDPTEPVDVLDLGCGTGKGTLSLVGLGHRVIGVDPSAAMLEVLHAQPELAEVPIHVAGAEALPLADGSVDAITCFQAWHWVDPEVAGPECVRVCRPGGILGMAWHRPDRSVPWVVELDRIAERTDMGKGGEPLAVAGFDPFQEREFAYRHTVSVDTLVATVASWSHVAISPRREKILADVRALGESVAGSTAAGTVDFPYVTEAVRARRP